MPNELLPAGITFDSLESGLTPQELTPGVKTFFNTILEGEAALTAGIPNKREKEGFSQEYLASLLDSQADAAESLDLYIPTIEDRGWLGDEVGDK